MVETTVVDPQTSPEEREVPVNTRVQPEVVRDYRLLLLGKNDPVDLPVEHDHVEVAIGVLAKR